MNYSDAAQSREKWGDEPCAHPEIEAEVEAGHPSNNYVCTTCGKVGSGLLSVRPRARRELELRDLGAVSRRVPRGRAAARARGRPQGRVAQTRGRLAAFPRAGRFWRPHPIRSAAHTS